MRILPILLLATLSLTAQAEPAKNLILITVDGLRWQELFRGIDERLINDKRYTKHPEVLKNQFLAESPEQARQKIFPFIWNTVAQQGVLIGNRDQGSNMELTNPWWFSYPGYNEILTGKADPDINSNKATPNPNVTIIEWLNRQPKFNDKVLAFGSWDVFSAIINEERSGVPVNAGFESASGKPSPKEKFLNELQQDIPSPWHNVRLDAFTHHYAMEALRDDKPRVIYIAYGETDDFAHDGEYDQHINAAHRFDRFLKELWEFAQSNKTYRNNTVMLVTTDHGRGEEPVEGWQHHGSREAVKGYLESPGMQAFKDGIKGAEQTWMMAIGPGVRAGGVLTADKTWYTNQFAATALKALGLDYTQYASDIGRPMEEIFEE